MRMIALAGKSGSGKTTIALMLAKILTDQGEVAILDTLLQPVRRNIHIDTPEADPVFRRVAMQEAGTAARKFNPDCFIRALAIRHALPNERPGFLIISDLRLFYQNEVDYCAKYGVIWHVDGSHKPLTGQAGLHESELEPLNPETFADYAICNYSSLEDLECTLLEMVARQAHMKRGSN